MGIRYRKSIRLGGGFRINLSKSGVGYSWGVPGYRITRTARGTTRRTYSIPGTGISYVDETNKNRQNSTRPRTSPSPQVGNTYDTQRIENGNAGDMTPAEFADILAAARHHVKLNLFLTIAIFAVGCLVPAMPVNLLLFIVLLVLKILMRTSWRIKLDYNFSPDQQALWESRVHMLREISRCKALWRVTTTSKVVTPKYAAGAGSQIRRVKCRALENTAFPFKTNVPSVTFSVQNEKFIFLPDKLILIQGLRVGAVSYSDLNIRFGATRFIESEAVPRDTQVIDRTWQYVNKSGAPDGRFRNNMQYPVCLYGTLELSSASGLHTQLMFSHPVN